MGDGRQVRLGAAHGLKRGSQGRAPRAGVQAAAQSGSLFERYVFLSPGVLMGLLVVLPMFSVLYIACRRLRELKVSYHAFGKEMGPAAQKK